MFPRAVLITLLALAFAPGALAARAATQTVKGLTPDQVIRKAVALQIANDKKMPVMRFRFTKKTPHGVFVKDVIQTHGGEVSRLIAINGKPLSADKAQKEQQRLQALLSHPSDQARHRQHQVQDQKRVDRLIRELPKAFLFTLAGTKSGPHGTVLHYTFKPNPKFSPPDIESRALTGMTGNIWIQKSSLHFLRLNARLIHDVHVGWGIIADFHKGGTVTLDDKPIGHGYWAITHLKLHVDGSAFIFKPIHIHITENESDFHFIPSDTTWRQAVAMLTSNPPSPQSAGKPGTSKAGR